jgi:hypothetical protein
MRRNESRGNRQLGRNLGEVALLQAESDVYRATAARSTAANCSDCVFERSKWSGIVATASSAPMAAAGDWANEFVMRPIITRFVLQSHAAKGFPCDHSKDYLLLGRPV